MQHGACNASSMSAGPDVIGNVGRRRVWQETVRAVLVDARFNQEMFFLDAAVDYADGGSVGGRSLDFKPGPDLFQFSRDLLRKLDIVRLRNLEDIRVIEHQVFQP